jgi:hypothetical protein
VSPVVDGSEEVVDGVQENIGRSRLRSALSLAGFKRGVAVAVAAREKWGRWARACRRIGQRLKELLTCGVTCQ